MCKTTPFAVFDSARENPPAFRGDAAGAGRFCRRIDAPEEARKQAPVLDKASVAALTGARIDEMDREELVRAIKAGHIPWIRAAQEPHLAMYDIDSLRRLVYLSRRICRNQGY
jgi:hypothetical protein